MGGGKYLWGGNEVIYILTSERVVRAGLLHKQ
jgi:hypothetical protein